LRVKTLGDLVITDLIDVQGAGGVRLEANGSIEQSDSGRIHTSFLETASSKGQLLTGENRISVLKAVNGNGDLSFTNMTDLVVEALQNGEGQINLLVLAGGLKVTRLQAAGGLLTIKADRLELEKLVHDGASGLFLDVTGSSREMAEDVLIKGTSPTGLHFTRLTTDFGVIQGETERLGFDHLRIGTYAEIENSLNNVIIDNLNRKYYETDLQLSVPTKAFYLMLNPGSEIKTNGFIIRYNAARISNDLGKTVLETTGDMQVQASLSTPKPGESDAVQKTPETDYLITGIENVLGGQETEVEQDADEEEEAEEEETGEEEEAEAQDVDEEGEAEGQSAEVKEEAEAQDADEEEEAEAQETDEEGEAEEQDTEEEVEAEEQNAEVEHEAKVQE
jgi:hypothetical protein